MLCTKILLIVLYTQKRFNFIVHNEPQEINYCSRFDLIFHLFTVLKN